MSVCNEPICLPWVMITVVSKISKLRGVQWATLCLSISCYWWSLVRTYSQCSAVKCSTLQCSTVQCRVAQGQNQPQGVHSVLLSYWLAAPLLLFSLYFNFWTIWNTLNARQCSTSASSSSSLPYCQFTVSYESAVATCSLMSETLTPCKTHKEFTIHHTGLRPFPFLSLSFTSLPFLSFRYNSTTGIFKINSKIQISIN